jgi:hypothetical protein
LKNNLLKKTGGMYQDLVVRVVDQVYDDFKNDREDLSLVHNKPMDMKDGSFLSLMPEYKSFLTYTSQFLSQVYNGGIEQWLDNGYGQGGDHILNFLDQMDDLGPALSTIKEVLEQTLRLNRGWGSPSDPDHGFSFNRDGYEDDGEEEDGEEDTEAFRDEFGKLDDDIYALDHEEVYKELAHAAEMLATEKDFGQTSGLSKWISTLKAHKAKKTSDLNSKVTPKERLINKEGNEMAKSTSLRERLAALKAKKVAAEQNAVQAKQAKIAKEARVKVASAWTIAKTMLPSAPAEVQQKLAEALLPLNTKILTAAVRQTAINSYWTKTAEAIDEKLPLNKLVEDEALLNKLKKEVERELKGEPKNASAEKTADYTDPQDQQAQAEEAEKAGLADKIEDVKGENDKLAEEINDIEGEELNIDGILGDDSAMDEKRSSLANEGDFSFEAGDEEGDDDLGGFEIDIDGPEEVEIHTPDGESHGPSDTATLEEALNEMEQVEISDAADYFATAGADDAGEIGEIFQTAADAETGPGEMADFFENDESDSADAEEDHADLIGELMKSIGQEEFDTTRDTEPQFEAPKAAKTKDQKKARPVRSLGHPTLESAEQKMLASLVFPDDEA